MPVTAGDLATRFWSKVAICEHGRACDTCCWPWQGGMVKGYGKCFVPKALRPPENANKDQRATRVGWFLLHGVWPGDLHVLHTCDNPPCTNPAHWWTGTMDDNQKDSMRKGRRPTGEKHGLRLHPEALRRGEDNPAAKLTEADVWGIHALIALGYGNAEITRMWPLTTANNVGSIRRRNSWRHLFT
jgi:hypothetical protein